MDPPTGTATEHALSKYTPDAKARSGTALCLSGGGYRAALFHLGALRRLNEVGLLSKVTTICSVSGGSILAAHLAQRLRPWPNEGEVIGDWDERVVAPFRAFTTKNIRTGPILERLEPWNWPRSSTAVEALAKIYERDLTSLRLAELPEHPRFILCATDMAYGVNWVFERTRTGDYETGYVAPVPDWPLARAVAASSCFPPVFNPLPVGVSPNQLLGGKAPQGPKRTRAIQGLRLSDGGVYDNMGLEPVWKDHAVVLVSDGGATFDFGPDRGLVWRLQRYTDIVSRQASGIRKRWLVSNFLSGELAGTYWGIGSAVSHYETKVQGYSDEVVDEVIAEVRTDLDRFSEAEQDVLENHGYLLAAAAAEKHLGNLAPSTAPIRIPYPEWTNESLVRTALRDSSKHKLPFGRR